MQISKQIRRKLIAPAIYNLGLHRNLIPKDKQRIILCYHGVDAQSSVPYTGRHIAASVFEQHLKYYRCHADIITLDEMFHRYQQGIDSDRLTLAITFDDGYLNNLEHALPLLERYQVPATFFISAIALENPEYVIWADILDILRVELGNKGIQIDDLDFRPSGLWDMAEKNRGQGLYDFIKRMPYLERDQWLGRLIDQYQFHEIAQKHKAHYWRLMNLDQIRQLAASPYAEIGSHGYLHYNLAYISPDQARAELSTSKQLLESGLDQEIYSLAFPDGNYDDTVKQITRNLGYRHLLALEYQADNDHEDKDILPRSNVSGTTTYHSQILYTYQQLSAVGF